MINKKTDDLCLIVTERCNLNCTYCQSDKSFKRMMSWECAKENVDKYLSITEEKNPSITFMGGEPFIAFKLIQQLVDYIGKAFPQHGVKYTIVTNGTLVHGSIQQWIKDNEANVNVVLSLDGLGETHNLNRCSSLQKIDLNFFRLLKRPVVNSVFTPQTVSSLAKTTIDLHQEGFYVKGFIADGEAWNANDINVIAGQLIMLIDYYLNKPDISPISLLAQPLYYLTSPEQIRRCGTELFSEISVAADGTIWACHRCSPFENHGTWKIPEKYIGLTNARYLLSDCESCILEKICNACPASNASIKDNKKLALTTCGIRKLLFKANAYFAISMLSSDVDYIALRHLTTLQKKHLAKAAQEILNYLS